MKGGNTDSDVANKADDLMFPLKEKKDLSSKRRLWNQVYNDFIYIYSRIYHFLLPYLAYKEKNDLLQILWATNYKIPQSWYCIENIRIKLHASNLFKPLNLLMYFLLLYCILSTNCLIPFGIMSFYSGYITVISPKMYTENFECSLAIHDRSFQYFAFWGWG